MTLTHSPRNLLRLTTLLALATLSAPHALGAQTRACDTAATLLLSDSGSRTDVMFAAIKMTQCHGVGPHVILELERRAPPDSPRDTIARLSLWAMAHSRMADSLLTLARDPRQPMRDRILYLRLLTHYADCRTALDVRDHGPDDSVLWMAFDACGIGNKQSYSDADRARIRAGFAWIGEHDGDANLANLARLAAAELNLWATLEDSVRRARERTPRH